MAFALFYNRQDFTGIAAELTNSNLPPALRTRANRYWNGGLKDWSVAPDAPVGTRPDGSPYQDGSAENPTKMVVISGNQVTKADFLAILRDIITQFPAAAYYISVDDISNTAVEPWPPGAAIEG